MGNRGKLVREERLGRPELERLLVILLVVPGAALGVVYVVSVVTGILFGNLLFALSVLVVAGWALAVTAGWGQRMAVVRRENALLFGTDEHYAREFAAGTVSVAREPGPLLVSLTIAVVLGWVVMLLTL